MNSASAIFRNELSHLYREMMESDQTVGVDEIAAEFGGARVVFEREPDSTFIRATSGLEDCSKFLAGDWPSYVEEVA